MLSLLDFNMVCMRTYSTVTNNIDKTYNSYYYYQCSKYFNSYVLSFLTLVAEFLGLPYSPPYMSIRRSTPVTGFNYASGSCGILPETGDRFVRTHCALFFASFSSYSCLFSSFVSLKKFSSLILIQ